MKPKLRLPLRATLRDGFDEADVLRTWRRIRAERPHRRRARWLVAGLTMAAAAVALALALPRWVVHGGHGPLSLAEGGVPSALVAEGETRRLAFADGSAIVAGPHTKVDVLANDGRVFLTALRHGAVQLDVRPGGSRRWLVEAGAVSVEVVGTSFAVERAPAQVKVSVARGVVVVRGERVPDHVQRLTAGEHLVVPTAAAPMPEPPLGGPAPATAREMAPDAVERPGTVAGRIGPAAHLDSRVPRAHPSLDATDDDQLIRRADEARRAGDLALAKRLLAQAVQAAPGQPASAVAALTLARLSMDDDPAGAARVLAAVLAARMPRGLEEDARARLVEARARSGDPEGARRAAREYHARFPDGVRGNEVRRWAAE